MADLKPRLSPSGPISPAEAVATVNKNHFAKKSLRARAISLDDDEDDWYKIMAYGQPGSGKTYLIIGFLLNGEKVFVANTDLGGNGLLTVKQYLKKIDRRDLLKNIIYIDLQNYDDVEAYLQDPAAFVKTPDFDLWAWGPTVLGFEGGTTLQQVHIDEKILSMAAVAKGGTSKTEMRNEGVFAEQPDWNAIRRITIRFANKFLNFHNPLTGQRIHKYATFLEKDPEKDENGNVKITSKVAPMLWTGARDTMAAGFDVILRCVGRSKGSQTEYIYECVNTEKKYGKNRGLPIRDEELADWTEIWRRIKAGEVKG